MTSLMTYRPASPLTSIFDDFFNTGVDMLDRNITNTSWPRVDISETDNSYVLSADLPGVKKDEISVKVDSGKLTLSGEKKNEKKTEKGRFYHYERSYGTFKRVFDLPNTVDASKISASYDNGVLELTIPKTEESKPKQIDVKVK